MFKQRLYEIIEKDSSDSIANKIFNYSLVGLILLNVLVLICETIPEVNNHYFHYFHYFDFISVIIFTIEYIARIYISALTHPASSKIKSAYKYIFSGYGIIDLISVLPFFIPFIIHTDLRFVKILRLTRFLRLLKIGRHNNSLNLIWRVVAEKKSELFITGFITVLILFVASFMIYFAESEAQPDKFPNILHGFWWAIATLTTVGYGDVYPITPIGKVISGVIAVLGIGLVALPTGLVSAGFMEKLSTKDKKCDKCPHCGKDIE